MPGMLQILSLTYHVKYHNLHHWTNSTFQQFIQKPVWVLTIPVRDAPHQSQYSIFAAWRLSVSWSACTHTLVSPGSNVATRHNQYWFLYKTNWNLYSKFGYTKQSHWFWTICLKLSEMDIRPILVRYICRFDDTYHSQYHGCPQLSLCPSAWLFDPILGHLLAIR